MIIILMSGVLPIIFSLLLRYVEGAQIHLPFKDIHPEEDNVYLCTSYALDQYDRYYITGIHPNIHETVHHMSVMGCEEPGSMDKLWDCGYSGESRQKNLERRYRCKNPLEINLLYVWSYNTTEMVLPEDVAYEGGSATKMKYIVLEIHVPNVEAYKRSNSENTYEINISYTTERTKKRAGLLFSYTFSSHYHLPPKTVTYVDVATSVHSPIHPLFYQVHTHGIGIKVSGYAVSKKNGEEKWTRLGTRDARLHQVYVPVENRVEVQAGDYIAHRCHYNNPYDHTVNFGSTKDDEMCNFFVIYWDDWDDENKNVLSIEGKTWSTEKFTNIPDDA